ncbi:hypothetical protein [Methanosarcina siciliae]|nr:hypothetical protein [Methanosarcina siciliae]
MRSRYSRLTNMHEIFIVSYEKLTGKDERFASMKGLYIVSRGMLV